MFLPLEFIFLLIYYGTSFEITPLKMFGLFITRFTAWLQKGMAVYEPQEPPLQQDDPPPEQPSAPIAPVSEENDTSEEATPKVNGDPNANAAASINDVHAAPSIDKVDLIFSNLALSAEDLAERMQRRMNSYLMLGITVGGVGLAVWAYVNHESSQSQNMPLVEALLLRTFPRITILVFIEVLAGFFLRQYRIGVEDFKYFLQLRRQADTNKLVYSLVVAQKDGALRAKLFDALIAQMTPGAVDTVKAMELAENPNIKIMETLGGTANEIVKAMAAAAGNLKGK
jgi:hypothetical protein